MNAQSVKCVMCVLAPTSTSLDELELLQIRIFGESRVISQTLARWRLKGLTVYDISRYLSFFTLLPRNAMLRRWCNPPVIVCWIFKDNYMKISPGFSLPGSEELYWSAPRDHSEISGEIREGNNGKLDFGRKIGNKSLTRSKIIHSEYWMPTWSVSYVLSLNDLGLLDYWTIVLIRSEGSFWNSRWNKGLLN